MAAYPKRPSRGLATEVLCTRGEEEPLRASSTVPPEQQRLVFAPSSSLIVSCLGQDPLVAELQTAQAVILQDKRALGRLVKPRVLVDSSGELAPVALVSLIYDYWQPTSIDRKLGPEQHLRIPLDSRYRSTSAFSIFAILTGRQGGVVPLPGRHEWSGSKTAAAVNQHQQRLHYIRTQQRRYTEGVGKDSPNRHPLARSDAEFTIETGPEWEAASTSLTFNTATELPWLQRVILKLLVIPKAPVDDNGGPIGNTSSEVTVSSSGASAPGVVAMASASTQPVPQANCGQQQTGGRVKQASDEQQPPSEQTQGQAGSAAGEGGEGVCGTDAGPAGPRVTTTMKDDVHELEVASFSSNAPLDNSGGAGGSLRRAAMQSTRSAGSGGAGGEPHGGSSQPGRGAVGGGSNGVADSAGDREDSGREPGRDSGGHDPKDYRKQKAKHKSEVTDEDPVGLDTHSLAVLPGGLRAVASSSLSDRDTAASPQGSSMSTTLDTVDASSDAADEHHVGITEPKPTVKLIPNVTASNCSGKTTESGAAVAASAAAVVGAVAPRVPNPGRVFGGARIAVLDAGTCKSGCCGGDVEPDSADGRSSAAGKLPVPADPSAGPCDSCEESTGSTEDDAGSKVPSSTAAVEDDAGSKVPSSTAAVEDDLEPVCQAAAEDVSSGEARHPAKKLLAPHRAEAGSAASGGNFTTSCSGAQLPPPSQPPHSGPPPPPPRPYPNGTTWSQPLAKSSPHGQEQHQHHSHLAAALSHMPHLPHAQYHGVHAQGLQNGKVRNGEAPDPGQLGLPYLGGFAPPGHSSTGSSPPLSHGGHVQATGQPHAYPGGVETALLHQLLLMQQNGPMQLQQGMAPPPPGQHLKPPVGMYMWQPQQLSAAQQQPQLQAQQQQHHMMHQAVQQHLFQQHLLQQAVQHQQAQLQQQQNAQQHHQQHHQLLMQGIAQMQLSQAEAQYTAAAAPAEPAASLSASAPAPSAPPPLASPAVASVPGPAAVESSAAPPSDTLAEPPPPQLPTAAAASSSSSSSLSASPPTPAPIVAPTPGFAPSAAAAAAAGDAAGQSSWETCSTSSVRSEPSTAVAPPLVERPMGQQHRVQSHGNILAAVQASGGGGAQAGSRDGGSRSSSSYRGRTSFTGLGGASATGGPAGAGSSGTTGQASGMLQGGGQYGNRPYGAAGGGQRQGSSSAQSFVRGGRYDGGSAESSRPSSRGPHPQGGGGGGGGGGHMRHPHHADPVPPPDALPLPDPKGSCDLDRFISQIEPVIAIDPAKPPQQALQELRLRDLWNFYFEPSLYGREVFTLGGHRGASNSYFVPYLSAIQIFTRALPTDVGGTNRMYVSEDNQGWPKHMHLKFEYFEQELPFNRLPLYDQIELLSGTMAGGKPVGGPAGGSSGSAAAAPGASGAPRPAPAAAAPVGASAAATEAVAALAAANGPSASICARGSETGDDEPAGSADTAAAADRRSGTSSQTASAKADEAVATVDSASASGGAAGSSTGGSAPESASDGGQAPAASEAAAATAPLSAAPAAAPDGDAAAGGPGTRLLYDMRLLDVHPASWFAVAWYPVYRIPDAPLYARFLTFHSFAPLVESMRNLHERLAMGQVAPYYLLSLPVVGLNWYNMQGERWMEPLDESTVGGAHVHPHGVAPPQSGGGSGHVNSPRGPRGGGGGGRVPGTDVWYQHLLHSYQSTADRLARGVGLRVLGQHGAEEVRLRVPDYEFFRARS